MKKNLSIKKNDVKIYGMSNNDVNETLTNLIKNCVDLTLKRTKRDKIVKKLKNGIEDISIHNPEIYDDNIREQIFFYMDSVFNQMDYQEIDIDELFI
ncbi:hypothetical protein [Trichloromonas sp.]|uniref:hypothetical protein n=1 Tax=Trichloromonas sp. TaxID=3069249 RepID=UPI002A3BAD24|nr:hypothetical protein [Trichloromonas sp.]